VAAPNAIQEALLRHYGHSPDPGLDAAVVELEADEAVRFIEAEERSKSAEQLAGEAPVVRFVNTITEQALADRASDIHIEPDEDRFRIRVRIDGLMRSAGEFPLRLHVAVASRIKILAGMDISDRRRPQDGGFDIRRNGRSIDVRVSTFPTVHGENTVMRLLDKSLGSLRLSELGLTPDMAAALERVIRQPHGIVLVTGPTGSGKSTTLYSALTMLNSDERNIITLEDPVEYRLPLVRQCQVNPKAGITFASGLRSILRQDPDIIMVGEIRDAETAEIAFQAALTGHLVLSTLHTNDAAGALTRMLDMNVEPFLISSSVIAVLAQRLVRRICERCSARAETESAVLTRLGLPAGSVFTRGTGCPACAGRGYRGRMGIYELLTVTPEVRRMVMERRSSEEVKGQAVKEGMLTLRQDGLTKVHAGTTTPEEVLRVTADQT
jgi:type II secretory ATPase GspE/PulE/Tfp pilus assembly ATPase PilB-like protein